MRSCALDNFDDYDLFSGFAKWFDRFGVTKVIDIEGAEDVDLAIEMALVEIGLTDPLRVWVEGTNAIQALSAPSKKRLDNAALLVKGMDGLVAVWFSEEPFDKDKKFEIINTAGSFLCEVCEDEGDPSECKSCDGEGDVFVDVRLPYWKDDLIDHLSESDKRGIHDLPESFWKNDDAKVITPSDSLAGKNFCENCGGSLGKAAKFCATCGSKT
jgi:hypothetical protein